MLKLLAIGIFLAQTVNSCGSGSRISQADEVQNQKQAEMNLQAVQSVGMPDITRFSEKQQLKSIYELRDKAISTDTYIVDLNGHLHHICSSVGYGIPYATQFTNPSQLSGYSSSVAMPQADPNGLYSPASADGTWVLCLDPKSKKVWPMYVEPRIIVSAFPLPSQP